MEQGYLIDTNVIIDYLGNKLPSKNLEFIDRNKLRISIISKIEVLSWSKATSDYIDIVSRFIGLSDTLNLDELVTNKTIEIRKQHRVKLPDAIIAATCMAYGYGLITHNISDFNKIEGLNVIDSYKDFDF
jgi:predicted nucleic acid-binding protein